MSVNRQDIKSRLFIGSTKEAKDVAEALQARLEDICQVQLWTGAFGIGRVTIEELIRVANESNFAVLILTPDDIIRTRGKQYGAPRDNVLFELGLCIGSVGINRTYVLHPEDPPLKLPSDLLGIITARYRNQQDIDTALVAPSREIKKGIERAIKEEERFGTMEQRMDRLLMGMIDRYPKGVQETDIDLALTYKLINPVKHDELRTYLQNKKSSR